MKQVKEEFRSQNSGVRIKKLQDELCVTLSVRDADPRLIVRVIKHNTRNPKEPKLRFSSKSVPISLK
ncbi:MAG: hypothetical protein V7L04_23390 [Nostoc sp.]|uniref:hypothetical protein n=1 Tax=Nostoc sp. TaxID=1180 RepID=UPI002FF7A37B